MGRRQALNAPIQGSASDVFKMAMIRVDEALREHEDLDCPHAAHRARRAGVRGPGGEGGDASGLVKDRMEHAVDLEVPLRADVVQGTNWSGLPHRRATEGGHGRSLQEEVSAWGP